VGGMARADYTVTFTAPKVAQALAPNCDAVGELRVGAIGSPPDLYESDNSIFLSLIKPATFRDLLAPRVKDSNKGLYGHVLVVAGSPGKPGAAAMCGMAALRAGAGLVTVASAESALPAIVAHAAELMTDRLEPERIEELARNKTVIAIGPGMGTEPATVSFVRDVVARLAQPMVVDADGLNALAEGDWSTGGHLRVLTPHPGEMSRLTKSTVPAVQADRVGIARRYAMERKVVLVLKGHRTLIAFPDGRVWINATGSPAMATGGTGDILTGFVAAMLGQFPRDPDRAVAAAVYLHGFAGELGASAIGEKSLVATDLLRYFARAVEECARLPHCL
jgi:ADP-dependent NAD(P)H-hydrate dehydratase / NAD(P)H-hydrate epimerase